MLSVLEINARIFVRKKPVNNKVQWIVEKDGVEIYSTFDRSSAYRRMYEERERIEIDEALYDAGLVKRPEALKKAQEKAKLLVTIENPTWRSFPICWKVYYGNDLIGAYKSQWEAEQFKNQVIMNGGY